MSNPFMKGNTPSSIDVNKNLPLCKELAWDFQRDTYQYDRNGNHKYVTGNDAIKVWVWKTLRVERYRYRAYYDDYGIEFEQFIGKKPNDTPSQYDLFEYVKDALVVNPYIINVDAVNVIQEHKIITLQIELQTIYGPNTIGVEV